MGVLNATVGLATLVLVGVVGFLGSEVVLSPVVSLYVGGGCLWVRPHLDQKHSKIKITGFNLILLTLNYLRFRLV